MHDPVAEKPAQTALARIMEAYALQAGKSNNALALVFGLLYALRLHYVSGNVIRSIVSG